LLPDQHRGELSESGATQPPAAQPTGHGRRRRGIKARREPASAPPPFFLSNPAEVLSWTLLLRNTSCCAPKRSPCY
jgi:hypothetical protein